MVNTQKLKHWTILTHAIIVIGAGHGIATLGILEIMSLPDFYRHGISLDLGLPFENRVPAIALFSFAGQVLFIISIAAKQKAVENLLLISGLSFLWLSIFYFTWNLPSDGNVYFATITAIPFFINTTRILFGAPIKMFYKKMIAYIKENI